MGLVKDKRTHDAAQVHLIGAKPIVEVKKSQKGETTTGPSIIRRNEHSLTTNTELVNQLRAIERQSKAETMKVQRLTFFVAWTPIGLRPGNIGSSGYLGGPHARRRFCPLFQPQKWGQGSGQMLGFTLANSTGVKF